MSPISTVTKSSVPVLLSWRLLPLPFVIFEDLWGGQGKRIVSSMRGTWYRSQLDTEKHDCQPIHFVFLGSRVHVNSSDHDILTIYVVVGLPLAHTPLKSCRGIV